MTLAGADDRADREIELPGDHQQRHRDRQDPELGRDLEIRRRAPRRDKSAIAGEDGEDDPDDDRARGARRPPAAAGSRRQRETCRLRADSRIVCESAGTASLVIAASSACSRCSHRCAGADLALGRALHCPQSGEGYGL